MDHRLKCKSFTKLVGKNRRKSLQPRARLRVLRLGIEKVRCTKEKTDKLDWIKIKTKFFFALWKILFREWKDKLQTGQTYLQTSYLKIVSYLECIKTTSLDSTVKQNKTKQKKPKRKQPIRKMGKRHFIKEDYGW